MNKGRLSFMTLMLVFLAGVFIFSINSENEKPDLQSDLKRVFLFNQADVVEISIIINGERLVLKKDDKKGWVITEPVSDKADDRAVEDYINSFLEMIEVRVVDSNPGDLSIYGLDNPIEVAVNLKDKKAFHLLLGDENPTHASSYAKIKDSQAVFLLGNYYRMKLLLNIDYFRRGN